MKQGSTSTGITSPLPRPVLTFADILALLLPRVPRAIIYSESVQTSVSVVCRQCQRQSRECSCSWWTSFAVSRDVKEEH